MANDGTVKIGVELDDKNFGKELDKLMDKSKKQLSGLDSILKKSMLGLSTALGGIALASLNVGKNFESAMSRVQAISGSTENDLNALRDKALEMGATTKFSATESAEALQYMAMAGWKTQDMLDGLSGVMDLAAASGEDLGMVSDILTDGLTAFGLSAKDSSRFADVLAAATSNSNTNIAMMGQTFKFVAPIAGSLGYSIEETAVAIGLMANAGIKGSEAGTALRSIMTRLSAPTKEARMGIDQLGISITNQDGTMKSFQEILIQLRESMGGLSQAQQISIAKSIAGTEAMSGFLAIVNASETDFNKLTQSINNSSGASQKMAKTMSDNLAGKLTLLKSTIESIAISLSEILIPIVSNVIDKIQIFANWILNLDENQKRLLITIPAIVTTIGTLILIFSKAISSINSFAKTLSNTQAIILGLTSATKELSTTQGLLKSAILGLKSPLGIAVAVLGALTLAFKDAGDFGLILKATLSGLIAGFIAFKTVATIQPLIVGASSAFSLLATSQTTATTAMVAFNTALKANPIGLAIGAITGLATAAVFLRKSLEKTSKEMQEYNKQTQKVIDSSKTLIDEIEENKYSYDKSNNAIKSQIEANRQLAREIESLSSLEEYSSGQKLLLKEKIEQLNSSVQGLGLAYDETSNSLNMTSEALEKYLSNSEAQLQLTSSLEEQARVNQNLANLEQSRLDIETKLADVQLKLNDEIKESYGDRKLLLETEKQLIDEKNKNVEALENEKEYLNEISSIVEENASIVEQANQNKIQSEEAYQETIKNTGSVLDYISTLDEDAKEKAMSLLDSLTAKATDAFNKINQEVAVSVDELINNLNTNTQIIDDWSKNIEILMSRGINDGLIQTLIDAGPEMATTVQNLVNASDEKLQQFEESFKKAGESAPEAMRKLLGLPENIQVGSNMIDNIAESMEENKNLDKASQETIKSAKESMDKQVQESKFEEIGTEICTGIASGIKSNKNIVRNAVQDVSNDAKDTFKKALDIHSPSRVFIGLSKFINEGIAKGINDSSHLTTSSIQKLTNKMIETGSDNFKQASQLFTDSLTNSIDYALDKSKKEASNFKEVGEIVSTSILDGVKENKNNTFSQIEDSINYFLDENIKNTEKAGEELIKAYTKKINDEANIQKSKIDKSIKNLPKTASDSIKAQLEKDKKTIEEKAKEQIKSYTESVKEQINTDKTSLTEDSKELINIFKTSLEDGAKQVEDIINNKISSLAESFQSKYDALINAQESLQSKLSGSKLFEFDDNNLVIENIDETIDKLEKYDKAISKLKEKGISNAILGELSQYGTDEALQIAEKLLQMTNSEFEKLNKKWQEKQELASSVAKNFYKEQIQILEEDFNKQFTESLNELPEQLQDIGIMTITGFQNGITSKMDSIKSNVRSFAENILNELQSVLDIHSPSRKTEWIGKMLDEGLSSGIKKGEKGILDTIKDLDIINTFKKQLPEMQYAVNATMKSIVPPSSYYNNNVSNTTYVTNKQGDFSINIAEMTMRNSNDTQAFLQQSEFYRKQYAQAVGGV